MKRVESDADEGSENRFVEGLDYYYENGLMVLTARYLKNRGYCCGNSCRHCPYSDDDRAAQRRNSSSSL